MEKKKRLLVKYLCFIQQKYVLAYFYILIFYTLCFLSLQSLVDQSVDLVTRESVIGGNETVLGRAGHT